jgi:hypothetical protein
MVDQLSSFAAEVTRVAREVGTEGKLGGQADVKDVAGTWKDLTDSVNFMAGNLTVPAPGRVEGRDGHRERRSHAEGHRRRARRDPQIKAVINTMVDQLSSFAAEVTRVAREVGTEGRSAAGRREGRRGTWKDLTDS